MIDMVQKKLKINPAKNKFSFGQFKEELLELEVSIPLQYKITPRGQTTDDTSTDIATFRLNGLRG